MVRYGMSFVYITNAPKAKVWQKRKESQEVTIKGSKDLAGAKCLHVMVAIAYRKSMVIKRLYGKWNAYFLLIFNLCLGGADQGEMGSVCFYRKCLFVMDNDPSKSDIRWQ